MSERDVDVAAHWDERLTREHFGALFADVAAHWDERYREKPRMWSGRVNATLAGAVELVERERGGARGRSVDLGCGEGGDVLWLASRGWEASGADVSTVAIERARERAESEGVSGARFFVADLEEWEADGTYDLITASFFQSHVHLDRGAILRKVAGFLNPGGALVLVSHAAPPPWAKGLKDAVAEAEAKARTAEAANSTAAAQSGGEPPHAHLVMPTVESELAIVEGVPNLEVLRAEVVLRDAVSPEGEAAQLEDLLVVAMHR